MIAVRDPWPGPADATRPYCTPTTLLYHSSTPQNGAIVARIRCSTTPSARRASVVGTVLITLLASAGCAAGPTPAGSSPVPATNAPVTSCVTDIPAVIARAAAPDASTATLPANVVKALESAADKAFTEAAAPGAVVAVRTGQGTWTKAYGHADGDGKTPMTVGIHTRIGSITKTFTGTVVMQLAEQGALSLDDPISKYVPGVPNGDRISLRLLANMTSGVASYTRSKRFTDRYFAKPDTIFTPKELLAVGLAESPLFEPGAKFDYSNTNTILLGMVVEKVTKKPFEDVLQAQVLSPLHLDNTVWPGESTALPKPFAQGYTLQGDVAKPDAPSNATHWNPAWGWTAGELISTIDDLLVYGRALGTGQGVLKSAAQTERLSSFPGAAGYGIGMGCVDGWVGHTGELPGYNTSLFYDTTTDTIVAVQTNSDIASGDCPTNTPTLTDNSTELACSSPATRIFHAVAEALGHPFVMP